MNRFTLSMFSLLVLLGAGCERHSINESHEFPEAVTRLEANVDSVNLRVETSSDLTSRVDVDVEYFGRDPGYEVVVSGKTLTVKLNCHFSCDGEITVYVPENVVSLIDSDSGNVRVIGLQGDTVIRADSGNITVNELSGHLDLEADSGNVSGTVSSQVCVADVDSGNVTLQFTEIPQDVDVVADSGNVKLKVPAGAYNIVTEVDSGNRTLHSVTVDQGSPNAIYAEVDSGNITITGY